MNVRLATAQDAEAIREVYAPYVLETAMTFELEPPSVEEMAQRIVSTAVSYPYIVAEEEGQILGFTYAHAFRPRAAYSHSVETSIYVRRDTRAKGVGGRLYRCLEKLLALQNVYILDACIATVNPPDEYVPDTSVRFHDHLGYREVARFASCGRKFNRWYDMVWMEKPIACPIPDDPADFIPFAQVDAALVEEVLAQA